MIGAVLLGGLALCLYFRPVRDRHVLQWAAMAGVRLTDRTRPEVKRYLRRARRFRRAGFVLGVAPYLWVLLTQTISWPRVPVVLAILPWAAGVVLAEVVQHRTPPDGVADLGPRTVDRYLPSWLVWAPRILVVVVLLGSAWSSTIRTLPATAVRGIELVGFSAMGVVVLVAGEAAERAILHRRRAVGPLDVTAANDAMRSQSVHAIAGAMLIVVASLLHPAFSRLGSANVLNPAFDLLAGFGPSVGLMAGIGQVVWARPVRRTAPPPPVGPPSSLGVAT